MRCVYPYPITACNELHGNQQAGHRKHPQVRAPHLTTKLHRMTEQKICHVGISVEMKPGRDPDKATHTGERTRGNPNTETNVRKNRGNKPPTKPSQEARTPIDTGSEGEVTDTMDGSTSKAPRTNKA